MEIFTASFPVVFVWIAVMESFHLNHWRTCFRQVLGPLYILSGKLLFFSFYCKQVWGWCLMPLGKPGPVTPLFAFPVFSSSICSLVWVGTTPGVVMNTLIPPRLTYGSLPFHHASSPHPPIVNGFKCG